MKITQKYSKPFLFVAAIGIIIALIFAGTVIDFVHFNLTYVSPQQAVIDSVGENECVAYYSHGIRDFTDYGVYSYSEPHVTDNAYFQNVTDNNELSQYLSHFESAVLNIPEDTDIYKYYDFDRSLIDSEDYFCIKDKSTEEELYQPFYYYDIYFFDTQSNTLHYFHNDI